MSWTYFQTIDSHLCPVWAPACLGSVIYRVRTCRSNRFPCVCKSEFTWNWCKELSKKWSQQAILRARTPPPYLSATRPKWSHTLGFKPHPPLPKAPWQSGWCRGPAAFSSSKPILSAFFQLWKKKEITGGPIRDISRMVEQFEIFPPQKRFCKKQRCRKGYYHATKRSFDVRISSTFSVTPIVMASKKFSCKMQRWKAVLFAVAQVSIWTRRRGNSRKKGIYASLHRGNGDFFRSRLTWTGPFLRLQLRKRIVIVSPSFITRDDYYEASINVFGPSVKHSLGEFQASRFLVCRQAMQNPLGAQLFQMQSVFQRGFHRRWSKVQLMLYLLICHSRICVHYPKDSGNVRVRDGSGLSLLSSLALHCGFSVSKRFVPPQDSPFRWFIISLTSLQRIQTFLHILTIAKAMESKRL